MTSSWNFSGQAGFHLGLLSACTAKWSGPAKEMGSGGHISIFREDHDFFAFLGLCIWTVLLLDRSKANSRTLTDRNPVTMGLDAAV